MKGLIPFFVLSVAIGPKKNAKMKNVGTAKTDLKNQRIHMYDYRPLSQSKPIDGSSIHFGPGPINNAPRESLMDKIVREQREILERERDQIRKIVEENTREVIEDDDYYEGKNGTEAIDIIEEFELGFCLGNVVKYVLRAGKKPGNDELTDLYKAHWYLERYIGLLKEEDEEEE
jgi:hypothetical protein